MPEDLTRPLAGRCRAQATALPGWIKPQLTKLVDTGRTSVAARNQIRRLSHTRPVGRGAVRLLTRTGLDWTHKYSVIAAAVASLCATSLPRRRVMRLSPRRHHLVQPDPDTGRGDDLVFDLLHYDAQALSSRPLMERKERLRNLFGCRLLLHYSDHQIGRGGPSTNRPAP